ncbi:MAG: hypothetical protein GF409_07525 [Candidatus Omnitrophica bacterium]|nr:hypothetical protein [Candidatus Omnitrophota bacterium]
MKLDVKALALAGGILWGASIFILTWLGILGYGSNVAAQIAKSYYIGYTVTPVGSIIGALYGFVDAGVGMAVFGLIYNKLARM